MSWRKVVLSLDQVTSGTAIKIQGEFEKLFMAALAPKDMALFSMDRLEDGSTELYFSPGAMKYVQVILIRFPNNACSPPSSGKAALLVGHADSRERLLKA